MPTLDEINAGRSSGGGSTTKRKVRLRGASTPGTINIPELGGVQSAKTLAQQIARLQVTGSEGKSMAKELLQKYGPDIPEEDLAAVGLEVPKPGSKSIWGRVTGVAGGALGNFLNVVGRPGQASQQFIRAAASDVRKHVLGEDEIAGNEGYGGVVKALSGHSHINTREMIGLDPNKGGLAAGFFDLGGAIATDPLTLLGGGTSHLAEAGLKIAGEETAAIIAKGGIKAIGEEGAAKLSTKLFESEAAGLARKTFKQAIRNPAQSRRAAFAERSMQALEQGGQGGIKLFGGTVVPGARLQAGRRALHISDEAAGLARKALALPGKAVGKVFSPVTTFLKHAIVPRAELAAAKGGAYAERVGDALSKGNAGFSRLAKDAIEQMHFAARNAKFSEAEIKAVRDALELGTVPETAAALRAAGHEEVARSLEAADTIRHAVEEEYIATGTAKTMDDVLRYREQKMAEAKTRLQETAQRPISGLEENVTVAKSRLAKRDAKLQKLKDDLHDLTAGQGRSITGAEGIRLGRAGMRADITETQAANIESRLARAEEMAPGAYDHAFADAVDEAMAKMPKGKRNAASARTAADAAYEEFHVLQTELASAEADGLKITEAELKRYGKLEGTAKVKEQVAKKAEAQAARIEAIANRQMKRAGAKAEKAADTSSLAKVAERSRERAQAAADRLDRVVDEINAKAATADAPTSAAMQRRLGAFEERVRVTESQLKDAEGKLARQRERFRTVETRKAKQIERFGDKAAEKYIRNNFVLMNTDKRLLHAVTPEGKKALIDAGFILKLPSETGRSYTEISGIFRQGGKTESRMFEGPVSDLNDQFAEILGDPNLKVWMDNPLTLTLQDAISAYRATSEARTLQDIAKIGEDLEGQAGILFGKENAKRAAELKFEEINTTTFGTIYVDPALRPTIERYKAVVYNNKSMEQISKVAEYWGSLWAGYATTPILFGTGFFARNVMGNMFNNFLRGVINPLTYGRSLAMQRAYSKAVEETGRHLGPEFDAALLSHIEKEHVLLKITGSDPAREVKILNDALDQGVHETGFFSPADLGTKGRDISEFEQGGRSLTNRALKAANPLNKDNIFLSAGKKFNRMLENNARLAHFIHSMDETGDAILSSRSVKDFLFDYGDLTPFEQNVRKVIRFYTYMRKNTPLQFAEMMHHPGKFSGIEHLRQEFLTGDMKEGQGPFPSYTVAQGDVLIGNFMIGLDTPVSAALQAVEPAIKVLANFPGVKKKVLQPLGLESLAPAGGFKEAALGLIGVPQGGPVELGKYIVEQGTGKNLFTGADIKKGGNSTVLRLAEALLPVATKALKTKKVVFDLDGKDQQRIRLLNTLMGLHVTPLDDTTASVEQSHRLAEAQDAIARLEDEGVDVPTIADLRLAGIIPPAPKPAKTKTLPKYQREAEALARLEESGVDTTSAGKYTVHRGSKKGKRKVKVRL